MRTLFKSAHDAIAFISAHLDVRTNTLNSVLRSVSRRAMRMSNITMLFLGLG